jgi:hypothetical protein
LSKLEISTTTNITLDNNIGADLINDVFAWTNCPIKKMNKNQKFCR